MPISGGVTLENFPEDGSAMVIGASGSIGAACVDMLCRVPSCDRVIGLGRTTEPALDVTLEVSIAAAGARHMAAHIDTLMPPESGKISDVHGRDVPW